MVKSNIVVAIQGRKIISMMKVTKILGMKVKVISLIWVTAWKMLIRRPMMSPAMSIGAEIKSAVYTARLITDMKNSCSISSPLLKTRH
jgi:hypothetical protein